MSNPFDKYLTKEAVQHSQFVQYLRWQHPNLLWWHTPNEGRKTPFERYLHEKMGAKKGVSDFIFIVGNKKYNGLAIELKAIGQRIFKKNGDCYYPEQQAFIETCLKNRFYACFACGFEEAKIILEKYLKDEI